MLEFLGTFWTEILAAVGGLGVLLFVVGNAGILATRSRWPMAADWLARITPLVVAWVSNKKREQAIVDLITGVMRSPAQFGDHVLTAIRTILEADRPTSAEPPKDPPATPPADTRTTPPAGTPRDGSSVLRLAEAGRHLGVLSLLLLSGCTRLERAEVAADVEPYIEAAKPVCKLIAEDTGQDWLEYLCGAASAIPGILRGMSTEDRLDASRPTAPIVVRVRRSERAQFERAFGE